MLFPFIQPSWSISVELFLYATLPLLVAAVRLVDRRVWAIVGCLLLTLVALGAIAWYFVHSGRAALHPADPASAHRWLYRMPLMRLGDFLLGILAARLYLHVRGRPAAGRIGAWLVPASVAFTVLAAAQSSLLFSAWSWDALYALPATGLILGLALAPRHPLSRLLARRPVVLLGEASFAFYLVHQPLVVGLGSGAWATGITPARVAVEVMTLGLAMAVAIGLHVAVEKPGRALVTRLLDRRPPPAPRPGSGSGSAPVRVDLLRPALPAPRSGALLTGSPHPCRRSRDPGSGGSSANARCPHCPVADPLPDRSVPPIRGARGIWFGCDERGPFRLNTPADALTERTCLLMVGDEGTYQRHEQKGR